MSIIKYRIWFSLYTGQWSYSVYVSCWQKVIFNEILSDLFCFSCCRAPLEEMLQRAGVGANNRGPPVPEGPSVNVPGGTSGKNYNFTPLP
jgi:hypothetical protein